MVGREVITAIVVWVKGCGVWVASQVRHGDDAGLGVASRPSAGAGDDAFPSSASEMVRSLSEAQQLWTEYHPWSGG